MTWPGSESEGATKTLAGSSQLFLFDQSASLTQYWNLQLLFAISTMERSYEETFGRSLPGPTTSRGRLTRIRHLKKSGVLLSRTTKR